VNQRDPAAWPISGATFIPLRRQPTSARKQASVLKFFDWACARRCHRRPAGFRAAARAGEGFDAPPVEGAGREGCWMSEPPPRRPA
jgi:hypothetical protein